MAELLIKAMDAAHPDPAQDQAGCYKRGDVVVVMPDGHTWGSDEGLPKFLVIQIPGASVSDFAYLTEPEVDAQGEPITRRLHALRPLLLPNPTGTQRAGTAVLTVAQARAAIQNKRTGVIG